jgi:hypothetical protein
MSTAIEQSLMTILNGDAQLKLIISSVHNVAAPPGTAYPHVIYHSLGGPDDYTLTQRIRTSYLYQIRIKDKSYTLSRINSALARIDVLLNDKEIVAGLTLYCRREGFIPNHPVLDEDGELLLQGGATYSIEVR